MGEERSISLLFVFTRLNIFTCQLSVCMLYLARLYVAYVVGHKLTVSNAKQGLWTFHCFSLTICYYLFEIIFKPHVTPLLILASSAVTFWATLYFKMNVFKHVLSLSVTSIWKCEIQFLCLRFYAVDNAFHSRRDTPTHLAQEPFMLIVSVPAKALKNADASSPPAT